MGDKLVNSLTKEDQAKIEKQRPKVDKVIEKCEAKKKDAAEKFKLG